MSWGDPRYEQTWLSHLEQRILTVHYLNLTANLCTLIRLYRGLLGALDVPYTLLQVQPLIFSLLLTIDFLTTPNSRFHDITSQGLSIPWKVLLDIIFCSGPGCKPITYEPCDSYRLPLTECDQRDETSLRKS
jgi:hypothetical protein